MNVPGLPIPPTWVEEEKMRQRRTAREWLQSAIRYCDWRADAAGRNRFSSERGWYLDGRRALVDLMYERGRGKMQIVLPSVDPRPVPSPEQLEYMRWSRSEMADELLRLDSRYTDRSLLTHLAKPKLAAMLVRAMESAEKGHAA